MGNTRKRRLGDEERFLSQVTKADDCWEWRGYIDPKGYARFTPEGQSKTYAHRWAFKNFVGVLPDGLQIDHLCRNRRCVKPDHLEAVTCQVNLARGEHWLKRKAHCPKGHPYDDVNTYVCRSGGRRCRACARAAARVRRVAHPALLREVTR